MTVVSVSMPEELLERIDEFSEDHGYTGRSEVIREASRNLLGEFEDQRLEDKELMEDFFKQLHDGNKATYGFEPTRENLVMGSVETLLISEDLRKDVVTYDCPDGTEEYELIDSRKNTPTHTCDDGTEVESEEREDAIEFLINIAEQRGTETKFISTDFEKGDQLYNAFGGIAGLLRNSTGV